MAYVTIPKDLSRVQSKVLFGLTKRQVICFGAAAVIGVPLFFLTKEALGTTTAALCMILVMLPFFLFAMYQRNGQPLEVFLGHLIQNKFIRPKTRIYQTNNLYSALVRQYKLEQEVRKIAGKNGKTRKNGKAQAYLDHINDEVHLYGLLHQLAFLAGRIKDEEDVFHVLDTAKRYGEIAEEKFQGWDIPGRYLVFGDPKDLKGLMDKELDEVEVVPAEEPAPKKYKDEYIIPGSGFRMLVGDIHHLIVLYYSLARRLSEAETEKDFLRLKKKAGGYEKVLKKLYRSLGLPEDSNAAQDILEESIIKRHNLVRLEDVEEPQDEGDLEGDEVWSD